jgi:hypothetical protein
MRAVAFAARPRFCPVITYRLSRSGTNLTGGLGAQGGVGVTEHSWDHSIPPPENRHAEHIRRPLDASLGTEQEYGSLLARTPPAAETGRGWRTVHSALGASFRGQSQERGVSSPCECLVRRVRALSLRASGSANPSRRFCNPGLGLAGTVDFGGCVAGPHSIPERENYFAEEKEHK